MRPAREQRLLPIVIGLDDGVVDRSFLPRLAEAAAMASQAPLLEELARCADCGRTPLIGEHVHLYEPDEVVCELCRTLRYEEPISSALVSHSAADRSGGEPAEVISITRRIPAR
jgi:hypothetical protein